MGFFWSIQSLLSQLKIDKSFTTSSLHACVLSHYSHIQLFATLWTVVCKAPLSMVFSRQEYWSGLPCLLQDIFPSQGWNPHLLSFLHWQAGSLSLVPPGKPTMRLSPLKNLTQEQDFFHLLSHDYKINCFQGRINVQSNFH